MINSKLEGVIKAFGYEDLQYKAVIDKGFIADFYSPKQYAYIYINHIY